MKYPEIDVTRFTPQDLQILQLAKAKLSTTTEDNGSRFICWAVKAAAHELGLPDEKHEKITKRIMDALATKGRETLHSWMFVTNPEHYVRSKRYEYAQTHRHIWLDQIIQKVQDEISRH